MRNARFFDDLSSGGSFVHRLHPLSKLLTTLAFVGVVVSFGKYDLSPLLPLAAYPVVLMAACGIPAGAVLRRLLILSPFALGLGVANPFFDRSVAVVAPGVAISAGWVSFAVVEAKFALAVTGALTLVASTGVSGVASAMRMAGVPGPLATQFMMTCRHIDILAEDVARVLTAHALRAPGKRGVGFREWGPLAGSLLLRSSSRASRVHAAMLCRGFGGGGHPAPEGKMRPADALWLLGWAAFFALARSCDIPRAMGSAMTGVLS